MKVNNPWNYDIVRTATPLKGLLAKWSVRERSKMYEIFRIKYKPTDKTKVLDIGATSLSYYPDSNMFERLYPYPQNLTAGTIESKRQLQKLFPRIKVIGVKPKQKLPFKDKQFDIAVSWATLEHVGGYPDQEFFLNELCRVSKRIFITTPYRGCIYEPHTGYFFVHWFPLKIFRMFCRHTGKADWSSEALLNPLFLQDLQKMNLKRKLDVNVYRLFGLIPSHLIITDKKWI